MPQMLSDMVIDEISLVDDPANEQARVEIVKAKRGKKQAMDYCKTDDDEMNDPYPEEEEEEEGVAPMQARVQKATESHEYAASSAAAATEYLMDIESLAKALEDAEAKLTALEKRADEAEEALNDAHEIIKAKDDEIAALTPAAPEDEVLKSLPESIRKRLQDAEEKARAAEEAVAKAKAEAETTEAITKARDMKVGDPEVVGPLMLRVAKGMTTADDAVTLESLLKGLGEVSSKSLLFKSIGSDAAVDGDPEALLKAKADEIQKSKRVTFEQAYVEAMETNPSLYNAYIAKRRISA